MMAQLNPANEALWKTQLATKGYATCTNPACRCVVKFFIVPFIVLTFQAMFPLTGWNDGTSQKLSWMDPGGRFCALQFL